MDIYTDPQDRCSSVRTSPYRDPIQCTRGTHVTGPHECVYTSTAWAA